MPDLVSFWGLPLTETLLAVAFLLVMIDFFIQSDLPTHVAYVLVTFVVARLVPAHLLYKIMAGVCVWFALVGFHYLFWRNVLKEVSNRFIAPNRHADISDRLVGAVGEIKEVEKKRMVSIEGDLWPVADESVAENGIKVKVMAVEDGALKVVPLNP